MSEIKLEARHPEENILQVINRYDSIQNNEKENHYDLGQGEVIYIFPESSDAGIMFFCSQESSNLEGNFFKFSYSTLSSATLNKDVNFPGSRSRTWYMGVLTKSRTFIVPDIEYNQLLNKIANQKNNDVVVLEVPSSNKRNEIDNLNRIKFDLIKESYDLASEFNKLVNSNLKNQNKL